MRSFRRAVWPQHRPAACAHWQALCNMRPLRGAGHHAHGTNRVTVSAEPPQVCSDSSLRIMAAVGGDQTQGHQRAPNRLLLLQGDKASDPGGASAVARSRLRVPAGMAPNSSSAEGTGQPSQQQKRRPDTPFAPPAATARPWNCIPCCAEGGHDVPEQKIQPAAEFDTVSTDSSADTDSIPCDEGGEGGGLARCPISMDSADSDSVPWGDGGGLAKRFAPPTPPRLASGRSASPKLSV